MSFDELLRFARKGGIQIKRLQRSALQAKNAHGDSLLHILAAEGDDSAVALLLELGCDVNEQNKFGSTAIDCAAWKGNINVVTRLLQAGADLSVVDSTGFNVIENLRLMGKSEMADWMETQAKAKSA
jgi:ankyrin repeat protein